MQFDNKNFESNVSTTMSTLEKLKQKLNFSGASKGLENVNSAANKCDMSTLSNAVETVRTKFSALQIMGVTALTNITNSAVNAGKKMVKALTIDPIKTGFSEYETQINAVQTILANTSHAGTNLQDVTGVLDDLNEYADKTIYNFTEMTRNIGTFTAAGVDLETSASAIQGIANLAAVSGSTSQQASTAMYQLSQAIANGKVNLQDWNSVVNAGMGGKVFQDALVKTAAAMKGVSEETFRADNITGSFRESISSKDGEGWLTSDVLVKTLQQFTMAAEEGSEQWDKYKKSLMDDGYTEKQANEILKMANTATDAATKVKTFTQLWDTLKESAQSGWTQSWEYIVGDFEEAKEALTKVSDVIGGMIGKSAESRNDLLAGAMTSSWDQLVTKINEAGISTEDFEKKVKSVAKKKGHNIKGLLEDYETLEHVFDTGELSAGLLRDAVDSLSASELKNIKYTDEFKEKLKETAKEQGYNIKGLLEDYGSLGHLFETGELSGGVFAETMDKLSDSQLKNMGYTEEQINKLRSLRDIAYKTSTPLVELTSTLHKASGRELLIESLWNAFDGLLSVVEPVKEALREVFPPMTSKQLYGMIEGLHNFTKNLKLSEDAADKIKRTFKGLFSIFDIVRKGITLVVDSLFDLSQSNGIKSLADMLLDITASIGDFFTSINEGFDTGGISGGLSTLVSGISGFIEKAVSGLKGFGDILSSIGNFIAKVAKKIWNALKEVFTWISDNFSAGDLFAGLVGGGIFVSLKKLTGLFDKIKDVLSGIFDKGEKGPSKFSEVLDSVKDSIDSFTSGIKIGSLVAIAVAVTLLSSSLRKISDLDVADISKGLFGIGAIIAMLTASFKSLQKALFAFKPDGLMTAGASMILIATAVRVLADAIIELSSLSFNELVQGLIGVGGGLIFLTMGIQAINKVEIKLSTSVAILALAESCKLLADALQSFSTMSWDKIGRGLTAMGGALLELVAAVAILGKAGGTSSLMGSGGLLVTVLSLEKLADALQSFSAMSWDEIGRGLTAMGGALAEVATVTGALGYLTGFSGIMGGGAILLTVQSLGDLASAFQDFGSMSWSEIGRGLTAMGGALAEVATVTGALGALAGLGGILGGGAILIAVQSLGDLASALQEFGSMSWDEIGRGLTAMGGALAEVAVVSGALGTLAGLGGILGGGAILIAVQSLGDLASAFQDFGSMSWDEIGRGLVAMGGALTEVAVVSGSLGALTGLAGLVGSGSLLLAVQGLGDIADALKKFGEMSWDEIGRGLTAMGAALGEVALGGLLNTLSGIGASALSTVAEPLGALADSVKKWSGVSVPDNLSSNLSSLAKGVRSFTFDGMGASALSTAAAPLGTLATSVSKWAGVTVPEGIGEQLKSLAEGVRSFTFDGMGASALSTAAEPLGTLADSVNKWNSVSVPESLPEQLKSLSDGIQAFTWTFVGGWSLGSVTEPLGALADAVKKWNGISISESLATQLGNLAGAVGKWSLVSIPASVGERLSSIADAANKLSGIEYSTVSTGLSQLSTSLSEFATSSSSLSGVGDSIITNIVTPIKNASTTMSNAGSNLITSLTKGINSKKGSVKSAATSIVDSAVSAVKAKSSSLSSVGSTLASSFAKGLQSKKGASTTAVTSIVSSMVDIMRGKSSTFNSVGTFLMSNFVSGINSKKSAASSSLTSILSSAVSTAKGYYGSFHSAGYSVASGFAAGISSGTYLAVAKARAMASQAASAAKKALDINSPSKVFYAIGSSVPEGFNNALADGIPKVYKSAANMANSAKSGFNNALSTIQNVIDGSIDVQPTIRPVLDLSDIKTGANKMNDMLGLNPSIRTLSRLKTINSTMKKQNQNGETNELVYAINKLRKDLGNIGNTTYQINGVTYDDGSNITDAVKTIVRAARVERRA
jgi:tape measure domain-containing protein